MRLLAVLVFAVAALSADTGATVVNYNSAWIAWAKQIRFFHLPPNFQPNVQVFCYSSDPEVVAVRVTLKSNSGEVTRVYHIDRSVLPASCGGLIDGDMVIASATVEPLVARESRAIPVQQR